MNGDSDEACFLPSFASIRQKTLDTLYEGKGIDKSPKGSVDPPIQPLVDCLNQLPQYATTSSCSGRIVLFSEGKGVGEWLFVSHDVVTDPTTILQAAQAASQPVTFRYEPLLLHVAAANMYHGQRLLQIALQLALRESGMVVTKDRVTVHFRTIRGALIVPLFDTNHLEQLVYIANERLRENHQRLQDLLHSIQDEFFSWQVDSMLPELNIWGHVADRIDNEIYVLGGYGKGPHEKPCARRNELYRLDGDSWEQVPLAPYTSTDWHGLAVKPNIKWTGREYAASCPLTLKGQTVLAIFGGRHSPTNPLCDLFLIHNGSLIRPIVQGSPPCARWGHTMTALSGSLLAAVIGGRDKDGCALDSSGFSVLRLGNRSLCWEFVSLQENIHRFHHTTVTLDDNVFFVFGGLQDPANLLGAFSARSTTLDSIVVRINSLTTGSIEDTDCEVPSVFGASMVSLPGRSSSLLLSGGCCSNIDAPCFHCVHLKREEDGFWLSKEQGLFVNVESMGPLVHHRSIADDDSILFFGGGTSGFAFGPLFSKSFRLRLKPTLAKHKPSSTIAHLQSEERTSSRPPGTSTVDSLSPQVDVVYVSKKETKLVKTELETLSFLSSTHRICPPSTDSAFDASTHVAIPVVEKALQLLDTVETDVTDWRKCVLGKGKQEMLLRSSMFASTRRA